MRWLLSSVVAWTTLLFALPAAAQQPMVTLNLDPTAQRLLEQELQLSAGAVEQLIDDELRALYGLVDVPTFLRLSANAQSLANKGLGVDYASNLDGWVLGVSVSAAVDAGDADIEDFRALADGNTDRAIPVGAGAQIGVMVGYSATDRLNLYLNGLYYPLAANDLEGTFYNVGFHAQYKLVRPHGERVTFQWGGLDLTSGVELSRMFLELEDEFRASGTLQPGLDLSTVSRGTLELEQRALTVPIELTTNVTLLYLVTLYAGFGVDFQFGDASMRFDLDSDLSTPDPVNGGTLDLGSARLQVDDRNDPDQVAFRMLVGLQLNIWRLKIFAQANVMNTDLTTVNLATGLRLVL